MISSFDLGLIFSGYNILNFLIKQQPSSFSKLDLFIIKTNINLDMWDLPTIDF